VNSIRKKEYSGGKRLSLIALVRGPSQRANSTFLTPDNPREYEKNGNGLQKNMGEVVGRERRLTLGSASKDKPPSWAWG